MLDVAIVGAGPVGLVCALALQRAGLSPLLVERSLVPSDHSRAIGIHPVSLELLDRLGAADALIARGLKVQRGVALDRAGREIGSLSFDRLPAPFRFVLALPQGQTEAVLEDVLRAAGGQLWRGCELVGIAQRADHVELELRGADGKSMQLAARYLVGCDGKNSRVRQQAGIAYEGAPYPDRFVMGDFVDDTSFGAQAAIFLHAEGLIESFPLPGGWRRWVANVGHYEPGEPHRQLRRLLRARIGHELGRQAPRMQSRFGVQHYLARQLYRGRLVLAGDAAHVVSPIGGQGMNLGFKDVARLGDALRAALDGQPEALACYSRKSRAVAKRAVRRAALYTAIGRRRRLGGALRDGLIRLVLASPAHELAARLFTMRGLEHGAF